MPWKYHGNIMKIYTSRYISRSTSLYLDLRKGKKNIYMCFVKKGTITGHPNMERFSNLIPQIICY